MALRAIEALNFFADRATIVLESHHELGGWAFIVEVREAAAICLHFSIDGKAGVAELIVGFPLDIIDSIFVEIQAGEVVRFWLWHEK